MSKDVNCAVRVANETESEHLNTIMIQAIYDFVRVRRQQSETFALWDTLDGWRCTTMCAEAKFELHLYATCEIIPWLCAAGRHACAKLVPTYVADMKA